MIKAYRRWRTFRELGKIRKAYRVLAEINKPGDFREWLKSRAYV